MLLEKSVYYILRKKRNAFISGHVINNNMLSALEEKNQDKTIATKQDTG